MQPQASAILAGFAANAQITGTTITYSRGNASAAGVTAVPGRPGFVVSDTLEPRVQAIEQDWIVRAADLVMPGLNGGKPIVPQEHDKITNVGLDGRTYTYELLDPPFRPSDPYGLLLRIHTKRVGVQ